MFTSKTRRIAWRAITLASFGFFGLFLATPSSHAIQPQLDGTSNPPKAGFSILAPEFEVQPSSDAARSMQQLVGTQPAAARFLARHPGEWTITWDRRGDRPEMIMGSGIPLIPGRGNALRPADLGLADGGTVDLATVSALLDAFIADNADLLRTQGLEFRLDTRSRDAFGPDKAHWFVEYQQVKNDVPVVGAHLFFRIAAGNIVQFGTYLTAPVGIGTTPATKAEDAFARAFEQLAFPAGTKVEDWQERGALEIRPFMPEGGLMRGQPYAGRAGDGYGHRLVWRFAFRVNDDRTSYQVLVDARTNQVLDVRDLNMYATAKVDGGIFPAGARNTVPEIVVPFQGVSVTNGTAKVTDASGNYDYTGGTASTTLSGKYIKISDPCGTPSASNSTTGNLALGTNSGTDCIRSASGNATKAARNAFYYLTEINRIAASYYPSNTWLNGTVTANVNINDVCNAYWDGSTLNFFKSGSYGSMDCANTGELSGVMMHEFGHGIQTKIGGSPNDMGTGEATGDTFAFLQTRDGCIGDGFILNSAASCTGVRDVSEYSVHDGTGFVVKPSNIANGAGGPNCGQYACPYYANGFQPYMGPMGYEGHCEAMIPGTANWDLSQELAGALGATAGWQKMADLWYAILPSNKSAYRVESGGQCSQSAVVNGCGSNNWYNLYLAADDDNGNLADGTPNACRIWDAFNAHGIACGTRPTCSTTAPDFALAANPTTRNVCAPGNTSYTINTTATGNPPLTNPISLSVSGLPGGVSGSYSPASVSPGSSSTLNLVIGGGAVAGSYSFNITGSATGPGSHSINASLNIASSAPGAVGLTAPANGASNVAATPTLTWGAVAQAAGYSIEVATDAAFTSIVASASNLSSPTWTAGTALNTSTTYYWRVRAENTCGNGAWSTVYSFTTVAAPGDCGPGTTANVLYSYGFESGASGWTSNAGTGSNTWTISTANPKTGSSHYRGTDPSATSDQRLVSPTIALPSGQNPVVLKFQHVPNLENNGTAACYDGGLLEVSSDGGTTWTQVPNASLLVGPYVGTINSTYGNPLAGKQAWCSAATTAYRQTIADVSSYAGQTVQFRFRIGSDSSIGRTGWDIDDVMVQSCASSGGSSYTVTPSVGTGSGSISPATPQVVAGGSTTTFTLTANAGFHIDTVAGTCAAGTLTGTSYTTGAITANCTVIANFAANPVGTPTISVTPGSLGASQATNTSTSQTLAIGNSGSAALNWSINEALPRPSAPDPFASARAGSSTGVFLVPQANPAPMAIVIDEGFDTISALTGWTMSNQSNPAGLNTWFQGNDTVFPAYDGATTAYIGVNFNSTSGAGTISNWLVSPSISFNPGSSLSFYTRTATNAQYADRLEIRACTSGVCTNTGSSESDVGDFTTLLLSINPTLQSGPDATGVNGYPDVWTPFNVNGLPTSGTGRIAFRYHVTNGGPTGSNSNYIGIDRVRIDNGTIVPPGGCTNPSDVPWLSLSPTSGTTAAGSSSNVTVTFDSTGMAAGTYTGLACINSNDPVNPQVSVPVSMTVTAAPTTHVVTPVVATGASSGSISPSTPQTVNDGGSTSFTLSPASGYQIASATGCGGTLSGMTYVTGAITADCTVTVSYSQITHVVTPSVATGASSGSISPSTPQTVNEGVALTFTLTPATGYQIASVGGSCGGSLSGNSYTTNAVMADCSVAANFTLTPPPTHVVTPVVATGASSGSISPSTPQTVNEGSTVTFTLSPATGYQITSVTGCAGTLTGASYVTGAITTDCTVTANFSLNTYPITVTVNPAGGGTASCTPNPVSHGGNATCTATASTGYSFTGWSGDCTGANCSLSNVTSAKAVTANFSLITHEVTSSVGSGAGSISPLGSQTVNTGETLTFTLTPGTAQVILGVGGSCGGNLVGNVFTTSPVTANCTVIANFGGVDIFKDGFED